MLNFRTIFKKKLTVETVIILCVYLMVPFVFAAMIPSFGGPGNDIQMTNGTAAPDHIFQQSRGGDDDQGADGMESGDKITQDGGPGDDDQEAYGSEGDDVILQRGKDGNDDQYAEGNEGNDKISQLSGNGNDMLEAYGEDGNDTILQNSGPGDDDIYTDGGEGDDNVKIFAGDDSGDSDYIYYYCSPGDDEVFIDGGPGYDYLELRDCQIEERVRKSNGPTSPIMDFMIGDTRFIIVRVEECIGCIFMY